MLETLLGWVFKALFYGAIAVVVLLVINHPDTAVGVVTAVGGKLADISESLNTAIS